MLSSVHGCRVVDVIGDIGARRRHVAVVETNHELFVWLGIHRAVVAMEVMSHERDVVGASWQGDGEGSGAVGNAVVQQSSSLEPEAEFTTASAGACGALPGQRSCCEDQHCDGSHPSPAE